MAVVWGGVEKHEEYSIVLYLCCLILPYVIRVSDYTKVFSFTSKVTYWELRPL